MSNFHIPLPWDQADDIAKSGAKKVIKKVANTRNPLAISNSAFRSGNSSKKKKAKKRVVSKKASGPNANLRAAMAKKRSGSKINSGSVLNIQTFLKRNGYYSGPVSGKWGGATQKAFDEYNRRVANKLPSPAQEREARNNAAPSSGSTSGGGGGGESFGGDTGGGGGDVGGGDAEPTLNMSDEDVKNFLRSNYGYLAAFYDHPEIGPILKEAAQAGWDEAKLQGRLFTTNWWQNTASTVRTWEANKAMDPATTGQQVQQKKLTLQNEAGKLGVTIADGRLSQMAEDALRFGWTDEQEQQALATELHFNPTVALQGDIAKFNSFVKTTANQWMVGVSDETSFEWAKKIALGQNDEDNATEFFKNMAVQKTPWLKPAIDSGLTMQQIIDPYREEAARLLEVTPDKVDFLNDPLYAKILDRSDANGVRGMMSFTEAQDYLRGTEAFKRTRAGKQAGAELVNTLGQTFGKLPGAA